MSKGTCSVVESGKRCPEAAHTKGLCRKHYARQFKHGDPLIVLPKGPKSCRLIADRFWEKVDKNGPVPVHRPDLGPCWVWTRAKTAGYGVIRIDGRNILAHRWAQEDAHGPIPGHLEPDHLCRNSACVKTVANAQGPAHIELVTHRENMRRSKNSGRSHCLHGHAYTPANTYLSPDGRRYCRTCTRERKRQTPGTSRLANLAP